MNIEELIYSNVGISNLKIGYYNSFTYGNILNVPGIYSWHISPPKRKMNKDEKINMLKAYVSFFNLNDIELTGQTSFHSYEGSLMDNKTTGKDFLDKIDYISNFDDDKFKNFVSALTFFHSTLYVGISTNLNDRIQTHSTTITEVLYQKKFSEEKFLNDEDGKSFFERVTLFLNKDKTSIKNFFVPNCFFVKIIYLEKFNDKDLKSIEYLLNRTLKPKFGKL